MNRQFGVNGDSDAIIIHIESKSKGAFTHPPPQKKIKPQILRFNVKPLLV